MELVKCNVNTLDNYLEICPTNGFKDNSIYEITINNLKDLNGNVFSKKFTLYTKLSPIFSDINAVKALLLDIEVPDQTILYNIREASRYAEYIKGSAIDENNIPFEVSQFVKYRAAQESLIGYSVKESSNLGISGKVGDVSFNEKESNRDLSKIIQNFAVEANKWMDAIRGYQNEGRAKPRRAVRGYYNDLAPIYQPVRVDIDRGLDD